MGEKDTQVIIEKEVVVLEKIVEREVLIEKIINTGVSEADMVAIQSSFEQERLQLDEQLAEQRRLIEEQKNLVDQEKQKLLADLENGKRLREEQREDAAALVQQLKTMEDKMLAGSQVMEQAMQQEQELRRAKLEVEERKRQEQRMKEAVERQMEDKTILEEKCSSTEELLQKTMVKLEKLWHRHKNTQQDVQDLQKEFQAEREDLLETIRDLQKQIGLVDLTIERFIPMERYQDILERAYFDEANQEWIIHHLDLAGFGSKRVRPTRKRTISDSVRGHGGPEQEDDIAMITSVQKPNVYFIYTEDGGKERATGRPLALRVGTRTQCRNFLHVPEAEIDDGVVFCQYPKARGLVAMDN